MCARYACGEAGPQLRNHFRDIRPDFLHEVRARRRTSVRQAIASRVGEVTNATPTRIRLSVSADVARPHATGRRHPVPAVGTRAAPTAAGHTRAVPGLLVWQPGRALPVPTGRARPARIPDALGCPAEPAGAAWPAPVVHRPRRPAPDHCRCPVAGTTSGPGRRSPERHRGPDTLRPAPPHGRGRRRRPRDRCPGRTLSRRRSVRAIV